MTAKEIFSVLSIIAAIMAAAPYIAGIIRKETKPHMFSWLIWGLSSIICGMVQLAEGAGPGSWPLIVNGVYCLGVSFASLWIGTRDIKKIDYVVLGITLSTLPLWAITKNPLWSVLIVVTIDGLGYIPTIRKSWSRPQEESALSWALSCVFFIVSLLALEKIKITTCLYPAIFTVINTGFVLFLLARRKTLRTVT
jgi:hypothetical protein